MRKNRRQTPKRMIPQQRVVSVVELHFLRDFTRGG